MKRRGREFVDMVTKKDNINNKPIKKRREKMSTKRKLVESPIPPGNEKEIAFLISNIEQDVDSNIEENNALELTKENEVYQPTPLTEIQNLQPMMTKEQILEAPVILLPENDGLSMSKKSEKDSTGAVIFDPNKGCSLRRITISSNETICINASLPTVPFVNNSNSSSSGNAEETTDVSPPSSINLPDGAINYNLSILPNLPDGNDNNGISDLPPCSAKSSQTKKEFESVLNCKENSTTKDAEFPLSQSINETNVDNLKLIKFPLFSENNPENISELQNNLPDDNKTVSPSILCVPTGDDDLSLEIDQNIIIEVVNSGEITHKDPSDSENILEYQNLSVSSADIVLDSPSSSFTIPSPQSSDVNSPVATTKRHCVIKRGPGKIRTRQVSEWKDLKRKALKNFGKTYTTRKGHTVTEKKQKSPCKCQKACAEKIEQTDRSHIFKCFWELGSHERQWDFISKYVSSHEPKRIKAHGPNKSQTLQYTLPKKSERVTVCRTMFLNTLSISEKTVRTLFKKQKNNVDNEHNVIDMRGRHNNRPKKLKEGVLNSVKNHILSLAPIESHYCRKNSTKRYLDGQLSYKRLHELYIEWFDPEKYGTEKATLRQYQDIVNANYNIAFYAPKKDQCDKCHIFNNIKEPTESQKAEQDNHQRCKNLARSLKSADKAEAEVGNDVVTACFDMQKILTCPFGNVSIFYYKRKLNLYNFTVYDVAQKVGFCYMWTEVTGKKGANEISSGLRLFIMSKINEGVKIFKFWSDNCSGQNRNRIVFAFYQYIVENCDIQSITHRFLEVGHTQNEGDSVHSVIEGASNKKHIYTPEQWFNLIRWAKTTGEAYRVKEMTLDDINDYRTLLDGKNWIKNDNGEKVTWSKVKEVHISKENTNLIRYKYELDEDHKTITTLKKKTRGKKVVTVIEKANMGPIKINNDKFKDLMSLCETRIIPEEFHAYFKSLPHYETGHADSSDENEAEE